jgi:hypothetical protein
MRVDLSELEETVRKLSRVTTQMGKSVGDAKYKTYLPKGALGEHFAEADELAAAHEVMKRHIEEIISVIHGVMDEFGTHTKKVHGNYQNAEHDAKHGMDDIHKQSFGA